MLLVLYEVTVIVQTIMADSEKGGDGTPLACAASMGREEIVSYLLAQDVQVQWKRQRMLPWHLAIKCNNFSDVLRQHH